MRTNNAAGPTGVQRKKAQMVYGLLLLTAIASAQRSVQITLPAGDYALFASHGPAPKPPAEPVTTRGGSVTFQMNAGEDHLYIWDKGTDDLGVHSGEQLKSPWATKAEDFDHLESVSVKVVQGTTPLSSGEALIKDGDPRHSQIVDASGPATFFDVKPGSVAVTVRYKGANGDTKEVTQDFSLDLHSPKDARALTVAVEPGPVVAQSAGAVPQKQPGVAAAPSENKGQGPLGVILGWLIGLGIAAAVVIGLILYMKRNSDSVASKLEQLGVQVPKPGDQGLTGAVPYTPDPIQPQPVQKIVLDDAVVTPLATPYIPPAPTATVAQPSLVSDSGVPIPLAEGETVVGREPGLGLSLSAESTVSRRHASIARAGDDVTVTDLGSSNGTFVNGSRLTAPATLRPGDAVQFGSARFHYQA